MTIQRSVVAQAVLSALTVLSTTAIAQQENETIATLPEIIVTATPFKSDEHGQILAPAKVLSGDELRNKQGSSLGDTLSHELGVSASAFGAAASRPIIRGLEGPRVKILQNGMSVSDVSSISNDHAAASDVSTARQVEILRGPAALLYGSGAIGGLINIVNDRIPTELEPAPTGEAEMRYSTADKGKHVSLSLDGSSGPIGMHIDGNLLHADDYKIPGFSGLNDSSSASGRLPHSYTHENNAGVGASYIEKWGHIGASISELNNRYGVPTKEGSQIDQTQRRYDIDALVKEPFAAFETFKFKLGYTDYKHSELDLSDIPETNFSNKALESRWELTHKPLAGWHGAFGIQTDNTKFSALSAATSSPDTVPETKSSSYAGFLVEERDFGPMHINAGLRLEAVDHRPVTGVDRSFNLTSYSAGGLWSFTPGYGLGATVSIAQRAPAAEELYSNGPHDATGTFDKGNANFNKETSRNIELSLQKTKGLIRWKTNVFQNHVKNFVYGQLTGNKLDEDGNAGGDLNERIFNQADATIRGLEAEISYNLHKEGLSLRGFADTSRGSLDDNGSLPLQPATRVGLETGYKQGAWRSGLFLVHAQEQNRLAAFETKTPSYTQLDMNLSYTQRYGTQQITWFALAKNLLNQDIRLATSVLKDVAPLPGRSLIVGVRTRF
ncbi:MAG: TonB-dependent receptor [Pseudomonadota bacterium]